MKAQIQAEIGLPHVRSLEATLGCELKLPQQIQYKKKTNKCIIFLYENPYHYFICLPKTEKENTYYPDMSNIFNFQIRILILFHQSPQNFRQSFYNEFI